MDKQVPEDDLEPPMTTPTASAARPRSNMYLDTPHQHARSCFWDYLECRWQCPQSTSINLYDPTQEANTATNTLTELASDWVRYRRVIPSL